MPKGKAEIKGLTVQWLGHSSIGIYGNKTIYVDPFSEVLMGDEKQADVIISTHGHRDHFDVNAINALSKEGTKVIIKSGTEKKDLSSNFVKELDVNEIFAVSGVEIKAVPAYNTKRFRSPGTPFHPEGFGMGVIIVLEGIKIYYAGDTDFIAPMEKLKNEKIDIAFLPIGGTYTMDEDEAVEAVIAIEPETVIPVHYNHIEGTHADPEEFKKKVASKSKTMAVIL